ncbi:MAG TPA: shikimate dehydrogenase [Anaerolineae bacterium]|jgi:shikimate dehydrogenase
MRIGLVGHPVAHSASPRMQSAAFSAAGLVWTYELWNTPLDELPVRMDAIRNDPTIGGANVTIPHKQHVIPYMDDISPQARAIGAVNTIIKTKTAQGVRLYGDNTDCVGFLNDLRHYGIELKPTAPALVLGAGGSAHAIVYALAQSGLTVHIVNRHLSRASELVAELQPAFETPRLRVFAHTPEGLHAASLGAGLIVNCTSAGMSPDAGSTPWLDGVPFPPQAILYDLVYKPPHTRLMGQAQAAGLRVVSGIGMLAEQGAVAFEHWTHIPSSQVAGVMRDALEYIAG